MSSAKAIILAALLAVRFGFAQDNTSNGSSSRRSNTTQGSSADQSVSIQGCLSSSAMGDNSFTLTQDQTGRVYRLTGNVSDLVSHAGHEIVVTGAILGPSGSAESSAGAQRSASATQTSTLQVSGVQMISDHCGASGSSPPGGKGGKRDDAEPKTANGMTKNHRLATPVAEQSAQADTPDSENHEAGHTTPKPQSDSNLPQTAPILPLLGLVGLSSLVTGFIFRVR